MSEWTLHAITADTVQIVDPRGRPVATVWPETTPLPPEVRQELHELVLRMNDRPAALEPLCRLCGQDGRHRCEG